MPKRRIFVRESHLEEFLHEDSLLRHETAPQLTPERLRLKRVRWKQSYEFLSSARFADLHFYHITNHLEPNQNLYEDDIDIWRFRRAIKRFSRKYGIQVIAYAIMRNHYHLMITAIEGNRISTFMQAFQSSIIQQYNKRHKDDAKRIRFAGRFRAVWLLEANHIVDTIRYIHLNPIRQGVEFSPERIPQTNVLGFCGMIDDLGLPTPGDLTLRDLLRGYLHELVNADMESRILKQISTNTVRRETAS
jgi:putative transposase